MVSIQRFPADWIISSATEQCRSRECSDLLIRSLMDDYVFYVHLYRLYSTKICWFKSLTLSQTDTLLCGCFLLCVLSRRALAAHPAVRSLFFFICPRDRSLGSAEEWMDAFITGTKDWRWVACLLAMSCMEYGGGGVLVSGRRDD